MFALHIRAYFRSYVRTRGGQYAERDRLPLLSSTPTDTRTIKLCAATMYCVQQEQSPFRVTRTIQLPLLSSTPTDTRTLKLCAATMYCVQQVAEPIQWPSEPPAARTAIASKTHGSRPSADCRCSPSLFTSCGPVDRVLRRRQLAAARIDARYVGDRVPNMYV